MLLKSSQTSSTIQCQTKAGRYTVVTLATKTDFNFSMKMGHFAEKIIPDMRKSCILYVRRTYFTYVTFVSFSAKKSALASFCQSKAALFNCLL